MAQRKTLTEKQVALLRWISTGCPDGVMEDDFYRISAAALRNRDMVTISGRGPTWSAKIAPAGAEYLKQVDGPNPPIPRQANVSVAQQLVDDVVAAGGSLRWIRSYVDEHLDPLASPPAMPVEPEIKPDDLKPFLGGASPYGPRGW